MNNIIQKFKILADESINGLTDLYIEQTDCLEQIVEKTTQQYRAGTSHVLFTPSTIKNKRNMRSTFETPLKTYDNNKENEDPFGSAIGKQQHKQKTTETKEEENIQTPIRSRANSLSRRRRRRTTIQKEKSQKPEQSVPNVIESEEQENTSTAPLLIPDPQPTTQEVNSQQSSVSSESQQEQEQTTEENSQSTVTEVNDQSTLDSQVSVGQTITAPDSEDEVEVVPPKKNRNQAREKTPRKKVTKIEEEEPEAEVESTNSKVKEEDDVPKTKVVSRKGRVARRGRRRKPIQEPEEQSVPAHPETNSDPVTEQITQSLTEHLNEASTNTTNQEGETSSMIVLQENNTIEDEPQTETTQIVADAMQLDEISIPQEEMKTQIPTDEKPLDHDSPADNIEHKETSSLPEDEPAACQTDNMVDSQENTSETKSETNGVTVLESTSEMQIETNISTSAHELSDPSDNDVQMDIVETQKRDEFSQDAVLVEPEALLEDDMDEDEFGDTIMISIPPQTNYMDIYESPVKIHQPQASLPSPIDDMQAAVENYLQENDQQSSKLMDLEKKILALKGEQRTPEKHSHPSQAPPSFLSPDVVKIMERNSRRFSSPPRISTKFFVNDDENEPDSPETPEAKPIPKKTPPRLHIVPTKFMAMSPRPPIQDEMKNTRVQQQIPQLQQQEATRPTETSAPKLDTWKARDETVDLSPINISVKPKRKSSLKSFGKPENTIASLLYENEKEQTQTSRLSGMKRKMSDEARLSNEGNKRMKFSNETAASSRLSLSSSSSISSYGSITAMSSTSMGSTTSNTIDATHAPHTEQKSGWIQNIFGGVNSFLTGTKKKPEEKKKKKIAPIKSLQQAEMAKKKEELRKLEKEKAAELKKKKLKESLEAQKQKKLDAAKKDDKKKITHVPTKSKTGSTLTSSSSASTGLTAPKIPKANTLFGSSGKPSFKKPDLSKLMLNPTNSGVPPTPPRISEDSYRLSNQSYCSEDEEEERKRRAAKKIPSWASGLQLKELISRTAQLDPDLIFAPVTTCDLDDIFTSQELNIRKRTSSKNWNNDHFTAEEEMEYKRSMGFV